MIIYVDIDETICTNDGNSVSESRNYQNAIPIEANIEKVNLLYDNGHTVIYWTARGTITGIDWKEITRDQLSKWGAKYHDLKFGKPHYDLMICDKSLNPKDWK
jgi:hypothetical protein